MRKLKIAFSALHPGSANTMGDLIFTLRELGHEVHCYPFSPHAEKQWYTPIEEVTNITFFKKVPTDLDYFIYGPAALTGLNNTISQIKWNPFNTTNECCATVDAL